jgi:hypothetical protein
MLPGFRFLLAAIVLSMSVLIFGLGATALLRAAHQEFASTPSWQPAPETRFAQQETPEPVLALLRVEPVADESKALDQTAAVTATDAATATSPEMAAPAATPEKVAALKPEDSSPSDTGQPADKPAAPTDTASTPAMPGAASSIVIAPSAPADMVRVASSGETVANNNAPVSASGSVPAGIETLSAPPQPAVAPQKAAALVNSGATIDAKPQAKVASVDPGKTALQKRIQRRRIAARARLAAARQAPTLANPFAVPAFTTPASTPPAR